MPTLGLSSAWWVAAAGLLLFLTLVVARFALGLVRQAKDLAATAREMSERLQDAAAELRAESDIASERARRLAESSIKRPDR